MSATTGPRGSDGRNLNYQARPYYCGPASLQNALSLFGVRVTQKKVATLAGTTATDGTNEFGLMAAIDALGCAFEEVRQDKADDAIQSIATCWPVILCVDSWQHWVLALPGKTSPKGGQYIVVVDPANPGKHKGYKHSPVQVWSRRTLLTRWAAALPDLDPGYPRYYGISVKGKR